MIAPIFNDLAKKFMSSAIFFKVDVDELQVNKYTFFTNKLISSLLDFRITLIYSIYL